LRSSGGGGCGGGAGSSIGSAGTIGSEGLPSVGRSLFRIVEERFSSSSSSIASQQQQQQQQQQPSGVSSSVSFGSPLSLESGRRRSLRVGARRDGSGSASSPMTSPMST
jgi:hypothetical protein